MLRREQRNESSTTDQRLLDSRGPTDWVHTDPWRVLRIQAEFVEGFGMLAELPRAVSVFGSRPHPARPPGVRPRPRRSAPRWPRAGFAVITGGGPGVMEAANRGARRPAGSRSGSASSCRSSRASTSGSTSASTSATSSPARRCSSSTRRRSSCLPGGFGTLDELFEALTLVQTKKVTKFPVVLLGTDYWGGLVDWIGARAAQAGKIGDDDLDLLHVTDDVDDAVKRGARGLPRPGRTPRSERDGGLRLLRLLRRHPGAPPRAGRRGRHEHRRARLGSSSPAAAASSMMGAVAARRARPAGPTPSASSRGAARPRGRRPRRRRAARHRHMRERKAADGRHADAFLTLPGGLGTLEELFEVWTADLGMHAKPVVLLDPDGHYDGAAGLARGLSEGGFTRAHSPGSTVVREVDAALDACDPLGGNADAVSASRWISHRSLPESLTRHAYRRPAELPRSTRSHRQCRRPRSTPTEESHDPLTEQWFADRTFQDRLDPVDHRRESRPAGLRRAAGAGRGGDRRRDRRAIVPLTRGEGPLVDELVVVDSGSDRPTIAVAAAAGRPGGAAHRRRPRPGAACPARAKCCGVRSPRPTGD